MRHRRRRLAWAVLPLPLLCAACGARDVVTMALRPEIPAALWTCPPQPEPPPEGSDDAALADWILTGFSAGDACRQQLRIVRGIVEHD